MDSIISYLVELLQNDPERIAKILFYSLVFDLILATILLMTAARVAKLEKLLKHNWPMKFLGKL